MVVHVMRALLFLFFVGTSLCFAQVAECQTLTVTNSTSAPADVVINSGGTPINHLLGEVQLNAAGGNIGVASIAFTTAGSGNYVTDLDATNGLELWLDDGDGSYSPSADQLVFSGGGSSPTISAGFSPTLTVVSGSTRSLWVVLNLVATAAGSLPETYRLLIANSSDVVLSTSGTVTLGSPAPTSSTLTVILFFVTEVQPGSGSGGGAIVVIGSGFTAPVTLEIGGVPAAGTPSISANGTTITGWVCPGMGGQSGRVSIVLSTGLLGPTTLSQTWRIPTSDEAGKGCTTSESANLLFATLSTIGVTMILFRLRQRQVSARHPA